MRLDINPENTLSQINTSEYNFDKLIEQLLEGAISLGIKIVIAFIVFIIGKWVIGWVRKFAHRFFERKKIEDTVKGFLDSFINILLQVLLFLVIVNILGASTVSFAAIVGSAGLAVGLAMKDNLSNFAGGVMLLINKPFKVGNRIVAQGQDGTVKSMGILYTVLATGDNRTIYIPNGPLSTGTIINFSDQNERRIDITLNIGFGNDVDYLKNIIQNIIDSEPLIKKSPTPFIGLTTLNNGTIDLTLRVWVNSSDYGNVNIYLNEKIYSEFRINGIYSTATVNVKMTKD